MVPMRRLKTEGGVREWRWGISGQRRGTRKGVLVSHPGASAAEVGAKVRAACWSRILLLCLTYGRFFADGSDRAV
jgi:hypothetical protein